MDTIRKTTVQLTKVRVISENLTVLVLAESFPRKNDYAESCELFCVRVYTREHYS